MSGAPKGPVPLWRWSAWWLCLGAAIVLFYVVLTPIWLGLRAAAWVASRARGAGSTAAPAREEAS